MHGSNGAQAALLELFVQLAAHRSVPRANTDHKVGRRDGHFGLLYPAEEVLPIAQARNAAIRAGNVGIVVEIPDNAVLLAQQLAQYFKVARSTPDD
jgi:hypothetical protein